MTFSKAIVLSIELVCDNFPTQCREVIGCALQSACKTYPVLAEEHLISPLLLELRTSGKPATARLLAQLAPSPLFLATSILPTFISLLNSLLAHSANHRDTGFCEQDWKAFSSISLIVLQVVKCNAESAPLTTASLDSLVMLSHRVAKSHWMCCSEQVNMFVDTIFSAISFNTRHAAERCVVC